MLCHPACNNGAYRVQHIAAGQIVGGGNLGSTGRLGAALAAHKAVAGVAQLHARKGVDAVVDTAVVRHIAAGHTAVGCVDNGVAPQGCDVPLPKIESFPHGAQAVHIGNALGGGFCLQIFVLHTYKFRAAGRRLPHIEQGAQQLLLPCCVLRHGQITVFGALL